MVGETTGSYFPVAISYVSIISPHIKPQFLLTGNHVTPKKLLSVQGALTQILLSVRSELKYSIISGRNISMIFHLQFNGHGTSMVRYGA